MALTSCSGDRLFEEFKSVEENGWAVSDSIIFDLKKLDLADRKSLIALRYNESYDFSNCYIRIISMDSTQAIIGNQLINMPLFDSKTGRPLGDGFGNTYTHYDTIPFILKPETQKIAFVQYMRQNQLSGIEAVGLKILK